MSHVASRPLVALLVLVALGCAATPSPRRGPRTRVTPPPPSRVEVGMSKGEVERLLGTPDTYSGSGIFETWRYEQRTARHQSDLLTVVHFKRGTVASYEVNVPREELQRPLLRPTTPGGNPHHGAPPTLQPPTVDPHGHGAIPPDPHGPARPGRAARDVVDTAPERPCLRHADCGAGRECHARTDNVLVCMGHGEAGAPCLSDDHCNRGLRCQAGRDGLISCR
jgi:hypothetical protein